MRALGRLRFKRLQLVSSLAVALAGVSIHAPRASACSPQPCLGGYLAPQGPVPPSIQTLFWRPTVLFYEPATLASDDLELRDAQGRPVAIHVQIHNGDYLINLQENLQPNAEYALQTKDFCAWDEPQFRDTTFSTTGSPAELPDQLGHIEVGPTTERTLQVVNDGAACVGDFEGAAASVNLVLDPSIEPWRNALLITTMVDGSVWFESQLVSYYQPPYDPLGSTEELIFAVCSDPPQGRFGRRLDPGWHTVSFEARLPGLLSSFKTETVNVFLGCDGQLPDGSWDAGSSSGDGGSADGSSSGIGLVEDEGGCGCRANSGALNFSWYLLALACLVTRRQWRRRK